MSGRRSRSRSPRRTRSSPKNRRLRSDGDNSRYERGRGDRDRDQGRARVGSSSDQRTHYRDREVRHKSPGRSRDHGDSGVRNPRSHSDKDEWSNKQRRRSGDKETSRDQENHHTRKVEKEEGGNVRRESLEIPREKNVLFPSGSNAFNRGRDRFTDRWRREERGRGIESRGRLRGRLGERSEGILAEESKEEEEEEKGERRLFEALVDPREVPRSGLYFEHDDRDTSQVTSSRGFSDTRRQERRFQERRFQRSPERWSRGRDRFRQSYRGRESRSRERVTESRRGRSLRRRPSRDREWRDRGDRGSTHSNWNERRHTGGRDRSPVHWKHDLFETVNQSSEVEEQESQPKTSKLRSKSFEEGIDDFNIDDLLSMDNPIEKMELDV